MVKRLEGYGLQNVKLEKWGPFGQSCRLTHFSAHLIEPQYQPLIGVPLAWAPGTKGVVTGEPGIDHAAQANRPEMMPRMPMPKPTKQESAAR